MIVSAWSSIGIASPPMPRPPALVDPLLLRQCHQKYHPDSGPIKADTAEYLEEILGEEMRESYAGMKYQALKAALEQRRKTVLTSLMVCRTWVDKFAKPAQR